MAAPQSELAHILFLDAVGYSAMPVDQQATVFRQLQDFVHDCRAVDDASAAGAVVRTPTGDGMALAFFGESTQPLRCACELAERIHADGNFAVRMGIHSGPVVRQLDVNGNTNVSGDGINIAQRVMDFGDGGHILMSLEYAKELQDAGDPAADDCHDIGLAAAKHGRRIHLFNYHRPAVGTPDVPVKVRKDDDWIRPKQLRLGTSGRNIFVATLQILGWLIVAPTKWRTHVHRIDPRLSPNFSVIDLTGAQVRRNPDLRRLLVQVYLVCPGMLALLVLIVLAPFRDNLTVGPVPMISMMIGMGWLATVLLGIGAGFIGFVILASQALIQGTALALFGPKHMANVLAVTAICVWGFVALSAVFPVARRRPVWREIAAAIVGVTVLVLVASAASVLERNKSVTYSTVVQAGTAFVLINVIIGLRWRRWSRGFMFGQAISAGAAALWLLGATATNSELTVGRVIITAFTGGLESCVYWATAFTIAERLGDARAAIAAGLMVTVILNATGVSSVVPLAAIWISYAVLRQRSDAAQPSAAG